MEKYFDIRYEFDVPTVHQAIGQQLASGKPGYICAADGNILAMVHNNNEYRNVVDNSMFSICDSSWVPVFVRWIYGYRRTPYCGSDIFFDIIRQRKHRMIFLGNKQHVLNALQQNLEKENPDIANMTFKELPFCTIDKFDYKGIAQMIIQDGADIIWVALGAPKQEQFMYRLQQHLEQGVMIAVGAVFNFYSGLPDVPHACPRWAYDNHMGFIHRIFSEPSKQIRRSWGVLTTLPKILRKEKLIKRTNINK